jgi:hypothetical protein
MIMLSASRQVHHDIVYEKDSGEHHLHCPNHTRKLERQGPVALFELTHIMRHLNF